MLVKFKIPPPNSIPEADAWQLAGALGRMGGDSKELAIRIKKGWTTAPEVDLSKYEGQLILDVWPHTKLDSEQAAALKNSLTKYVYG